MTLIEKKISTISDLQIFARVARTGNMSAAGREMGLSPAVVSKRVSLLEEQLGARLFQRTTRQLTLTDIGEGFYKRCVDILNLVDEAEDFVSRRNSAPKGVLKITAPTGFGRTHIAPCLAEFARTYPQLEVDISLTDTATDIIRDGHDIAIRIGDLPDKSLTSRRFGTVTQVLCAAPAYFATLEWPREVDDLFYHNCLAAGPVDNWTLEGPDGEQTVKIRSTIRSNSSDLVKAGVLAGCGIGLFALWDVEAEIASGALEVVLPEFKGAGKTALFAVYPCRDYLPAKVTIFLDFLEERLVRRLGETKTVPVEQRRRPMQVAAE